LSSADTGDGGLYYTSYAYADTFLAGAIVAHLYLRDQILGGLNPIILLAVSVASSTFILIAWKMPTHTFRTSLVYGLLPAATAAILSLSLRDGLISRTLALRPFVWLGRLSYSLYLVHLTALYHIERATDNIITKDVFFVGCTLGLALMLHYGVEKPGLWIKERSAAITFPFPWATVLTWSALLAGTARLVSNGYLF
jgi:peptidoglycan/LPS O-acetylase OafA/YrhL